MLSYCPIFLPLVRNVDKVTKRNKNIHFKVRGKGPLQTKSWESDLSGEQTCFSVSSYQFLEDAYKNHRHYLENMTHQLQEKRKGIEEMSSYISKG